MTSFKLQSDFQTAASERARANGVQILNSTGDGFLFLCNPADPNWCVALTAFYLGLVEDLQTLLAEVNRVTGQHLRSGLRLGVSSGNIAVGPIGIAGQIGATGPEINLAARLCARAGINEIVFSSQTWAMADTSLIRWNASQHHYTDLKGFDHAVAAVHVTL